MLYLSHYDRREYAEQKVALLAYAETAEPRVKLLIEAALRECEGSATELRASKAHIIHRLLPEVKRLDTFLSGGRNHDANQNGDLQSTIVQHETAAARAAIALDVVQALAWTFCPTMEDQAVIALRGKDAPYRRDAERSAWNAGFRSGYLDEPVPEGKTKAWHKGHEDGYVARRADGHPEYASN